MPDLTSPRPAIWASLFYIAATIALTYPLVLRLGTIVPSDPGDPLLTAWILWWNTQAVPYTETWWSAPSFFPSPDSLALSEHLFGLSLFTTPVIWLTGNVQLASNVAFLLTFILSALAGYALGFTLTKRSDAAWVAGLAFGFAPYRMAQFPHIQTLASFWMPFALVGLHKYLEDRRARWLALFGASTLVQGLTNGYYLLFFPVLVGLWVLWFLPAGRRVATLTAIGGTFVAASLPLVPLLLHYRAVHERFGLQRGIAEAADFSADITALVHGTPDLAVWGRWLPHPGPEAQLFPGLTVVLLIVAALVWGRRDGKSRGEAASVAGRRRVKRIRVAIGMAATLVSAVVLSLLVYGPWKVDVLGLSISVRRMSRPLSEAVLLWLVFALMGPRARALLRSQSPLVFYIAATVVMWVLSFGPGPRFRDQQVLYWAPYRWLMLLPGFDGLRVPARFAMLATLCLAAAAGLALAVLLPRLTRRGQIALVALVAAGVLADGWLRSMPLAHAPAPSVLSADDEPGAVLELPFGDTTRDVASMYRSIVHRHPVVNGFSGYGPPHYDILRVALESRDPSVLVELATRGLRHVVVFADGDPDGRWQAYVKAYPGATFVRTANGQAHYRLAPTESGPWSRAGASPVPIARVQAASREEEIGWLQDGDPATFWTPGHPQTGGDDEQLVIDLGAVRSLSGVDLALGSHRGNYPRELSIERSLDGEGWAHVWRGRTAGLAVSAALDDPSRLPLRVRFGRVPARYLRVRQLGSDPVFYWSVAELAVVGPAEPTSR